MLFLAYFYTDQLSDRKKTSTVLTFLIKNNRTLEPRFGRDKGVQDGGSKKNNSNSVEQ